MQKYFERVEQLFILETQYREVFAAGYQLAEVKTLEEEIVQLKYKNTEESLKRVAELQEQVNTLATGAIDQVLVADLRQRIDDARGALSKMTAPQDASRYIQADEEGTVDTILLTSDDAGHRLAKIKIRKVHSLKPGDKVATAQAQKMTVSRTYRDEDMPFIGKTGVTLSALINPTCIPSRMTVGLLMEMVTGNYNSEMGTRSDGTAFRPAREVNIIMELSKRGFSRAGVHEVYNPITGEKYNALIMAGPAYVKKLKHQVEDKIRARGEGGYDPETGQAKQGRKNGGGIRLGEMERDCIIAHGAAASLKDRLNTDAHLTVWCQNCGIRASMSDHPISYHCRECNGTKFGVMNTPEALHYMFLMFGGIGVIPRIGFKEGNLGPHNILRTGAAGGAPSALDEATEMLNKLSMNACAANTDTSAGFSRTAEANTLNEWAGQNNHEDYAEYNGGVFDDDFNYNEYGD
jgi:hypothetical protein